MISSRYINAHKALIEITQEEKISDKDAAEKLGFFLNESEPDCRPRIFSKDDAAYVQMNGEHEITAYARFVNLLNKLVLNWQSADIIDEINLVNAARRNVTSIGLTPGLHEHRCRVYEDYRRSKRNLEQIFFVRDEFLSFLRANHVGADQHQPDTSASLCPVPVPAPVPVPVVAPTGGWWSAVLPYIAEKMKAERCKTAKELFRVLEIAAAQKTGPFDKVSGNLFAREFGESMSMKTLQNRIGDVRAAAGLRR